MAANTSGYLLGAGTTISLSTAGASFDGASGAAGTIMAHIISADIPDKSIQMIEQSILSSATAVKEHAGAAVAAGASLKSDASGRAITWVTSGAKIAIALDAATGAGQFIEVLLIPNVA